ncbi:hypothetical protein FM119_02955 [Mycetocola reblochoni REB411]|uniref:Uncharacterized protein n=1 Tax=Mycetocola reblochoni REB411 TaxID=1255698 RepID=A0A1R4IQ10_9MICO|nr:hypothetical protein FM119_02955 [Mycetocola reblochoni REB411]
MEQRRAPARHRQLGPPFGPGGLCGVLGCWRFAHLRAPWIIRGLGRRAKRRVSATGRTLLLLSIERPHTASL